LTPDFWLERWKSGEIGFHRSAAHDFLPRHWPSLGLAPGSPVLVPLCGKSVDMLWLAAQGHRVIGVELSPLAVDAFFREHGLEAETRSAGAFVVTSAGPFTIWCGDMLALPAEAVVDVAACYDRAALVAFPPTLQPAYAKKLCALLPGDAPIFVVGLSYPEGQLSGPPFSTPLTRIAALFGGTYTISVAETRDGLEESRNIKERGVTALDEAAYILRRTVG
jgi:thiopurine S-methyltransferase